MAATPQHRILFVCLGNICRSPLAEGVFTAVVAKRGLADLFEIDSAGTGAWHAGSQPDPRSIAVAERYGIDLRRQKARAVSAEDFARFDWLLGMDNSNVATLQALAPYNSKARIGRFIDLATGVPRNIEDPYYGGDGGFEEAYQLIRSASDALLEKLISGGAPAKG